MSSSKLFDDVKRMKKDLKYDLQYFYIISNPIFPGYFKIGITINPTSRLYSYQIADPNRGFKMEFCFPTVKHSLCEKLIMQKYKSKYEWIKEDDIQNIIDIIKTIILQ